MHLIQTEKMSSIGILATGIAHEINTPLSSVAVCAEALMRRLREESDLVRDKCFDTFDYYLNVISRESHRCRGIIDSLLSFGRKSDGISVNVDMNAVLQEILELVSHHPAYRDVCVISTLKSDLPCVHGDPSALRQVCMNLLLNALQSISGQGEVQLVSSGSCDGMIDIVVRDNGCGIAREHIDRIWDPFYTTKEVGKGLGLGLALTYSIVKRHGGDIHVTSTLGKGSEFTVSLPVCKS